MTDRTEVLIDRPAAEGEVEAVTKVFDDLGLGVTVEAGYEVRGAGDYPWIVAVGLASGTTIAIFLKKVAELAAEDAYVALKRWVKAVADSRRPFRSTSGRIELKDDRISALILHEDLPDDAFEALADMDFDALPDHAHLVWDEDTGEWKNH